MPKPLSFVTRYLETLRFPVLLLVTLALLAVNLVVPDALPFVDELLMALTAMLLARLKRKPPPRPEPPANLERDSTETK